jgi:protein ImuA
MGFALMLMARTLAHRRDAMGLIVQSAGAEREGGGLYGPGLAALGLDPGRLVLVRVGRASEALQVMDEALRSGAAAAVVAEVDRSDPLTLAATQKFNFWAQDHDLMAFIASYKPSGNSAAMTRWQVAAAPSAEAVAWARRRGLRRPRLGAAGLELVLSRNRRSVAGGGSSGRWIVEWNGEECGFRTPEALPASVAGATGHRPDTAVA